MWTLILLSLIAKVALALQDRSSYLVKGLDDVEPAYKLFQGEMYAGLIPFESSATRSGEYMFWLFLPTKPSVNSSIVVWLNGGPGCSSLEGGVMFENSPVTVPLRNAGYCCAGGQDPLEYNEYAWTQATNMLYVEQPGGVGFSTGSEPVNEDELAADFYAWLTNFYLIFSDMSEKDLSIFGESYAGMYVPSIARTIHIENVKKRKNHINLFGIGVGNGWMDALTQGPAVIDYAWWHGMIDSETRRILTNEWERCATHFKVTPPLHPFTVPDECGIMASVLDAAGNGLLKNRAPNTYDVTTFDTYAVLSDDPTTTIASFYNNERVRTALNVPNTSKLWKGCMPGQGRRRLKEEPKLLDHDRPMSTAPYLVELMKAGIRVLIYNGDRDMSTNSAGTEMVLDKIMPPGWPRARRGLWVVQDEMAGWAKEFENLSFLVVYNSGHLVPFNQPMRSLELLQRFLVKDTFIDSEIPRFVSSGSDDDDWEKGRSIVTIGLVAIVAFTAGVMSILLFSRHSKRGDYTAVQR